MNSKPRFIPENKFITLNIEPVPPVLRLKSKNGGPFELKRFWKHLSPWLKWGVIIVAGLNIGTFLGWVAWNIITL